MAQSSATLNVDVVSDVVCPWCYVGKRHLDLAMAQMPDVSFDVRWRPFQLNPQMPREGMGREEYMAKKFGAGGPTKNFYEALENTGKGLGIDFQFEKIQFAPNTLDAHRLIHWASGGENKNIAAQSRLATRLFEVYFVEGGDVGNRDVLIDVARALGMNGELVGELLGSERDVEAIREQVGVAGKMGITGVPCFIIENKHAVMGAQKPEALVEAFESAIAEKSGEATTPETEMSAS